VISKVEYFGATWCGPCKTFKPVLMSTVDENKLEIFDVEENQDLASSRGVRSIPTTIFYDEDGDEIKRFVGSKNKQDLEKAMGLEIA
jgi:thiol-disulfide isomerase/thioredoxin